MEDSTRSEGASTASYETDVLVVGGGPVGMMMAYQLARSGISCMMVEQELHTTLHPKMEFLSPRSMEIFKHLGMADRLRAIAVPERYRLDELFSTGLSNKNGNLKTLFRDSPETLRRKWLESNDGSHPREPWMRFTQIVFEAWIKPICQAEPLIDDHWGWSFESLEEKEGQVLSYVNDAQGRKVVVKSKYVTGCDGAGSKVRAASKLESKRQATPIHISTTHFLSRDLRTLQSQGLFWHLNFLTGACLISQDEVETFTYHEIIPPGAEAPTIEPLEVLRRGLGGIDEPCDIEVKKILNTSVWRSYLSTAEAFRSTKGRVFLVGDAAHQLSPIGGLGLNSGIADTFDLCWKLAAVLKGYGGEYLLASYDHERRLVAKENVQRVEEAMSSFVPLLTHANTVGRDVIMADSEAGQEARTTLTKMVQDAAWIHEQDGTWVDFRYNDSPIVIPQLTGSPPPRKVTEIVPIVWPGSRAPHVWLSDGKSVFDLYENGFNLLDFTAQEEVSSLFRKAADEMHIPLKCFSLHSEKHAHSIYQRDAVLVRPDGHVAWCMEDGAVSPMSVELAKEIMAVAAGRKPAPLMSLPN